MIKNTGQVEAKRRKVVIGEAPVQSPAQDRGLAKEPAAVKEQAVQATEVALLVAVLARMKAVDESQNVAEDHGQGHQLLRHHQEGPKNEDIETYILNSERIIDVLLFVRTSSVVVKH